MWINRKDYQELVATVDKLNEELKRLSKFSYVVDIKEKGLKKEFIFYQEGKLYQIEAVQIISGGKDIIPIAPVNR